VVLDKVLYRLKRGEMPPPGAKKPSDAELQPVMAWIEAEAKPAPGRAQPIRAEYLYAA